MKMCTKDGDQGKWTKQYNHANNYKIEDITYIIATKRIMNLRLLCSTAYFQISITEKQKAKNMLNTY